MTGAELPPEVAEVYSEDGYYAVIPEWVLDADISALAVRLYGVLRRYADQRTMHAHPSRKTLADRLRVKSVRTVDGAIAELKGIGALRTFTRWTAAGDPDSNGYVLHRTPRFDTDTAPPVLPLPGVVQQIAPPSTAGGGAADCTGGGAADCETVVQQAAPKPQPLNHSQLDHSDDLGGVSLVSSADVEEPPRNYSIEGDTAGDQRDAMGLPPRTCPDHRVRAALGNCGACGRYRRTYEAAVEKQLAEESGQRAAADRAQAARMRDLGRREIAACGLCDAEGVPHRADLRRCLHDAQRNETAVAERKRALRELADRRPDVHGRTG